ncbi:MAG: TIR domain-containing protein, partial [bacterium]|nr:TIR domain-containing protein [bacterium]
MAKARSIKLFISYSRKDQALREELDNHLAGLKRSKLIDVWHDRAIKPGEDFKTEIDRNLNDADMILLLVSANFTSSEYCWGIELTRALERHEAGEARVIPVILKPVDLEVTPFAEIQALPKDALPVSKWEDRDEALADVAKGIRKVAQELAKKVAAPPAAQPAEPASPPAAKPPVPKTASPPKPKPAPVSKPPRQKPAPKAEPAKVVQAGEVKTNPADGMPYVWIPPGSFEMGASAGDKEAYDDAKPRHKVTISKGFWIGQTPVTVAAYKKFKKVTGQRGDDHPVVEVSWKDAKA